MFCEKITPKINLKKQDRKNSRYNKKILFIFFIVITITIVFMILSNRYNYSNSKNKQIDNQTQTNKNVPKQSNAIEPKIKVDYSEGYKAGYVDGRSSSGDLGDSYAGPAAGERKKNYIDGYLDGFLTGCGEGNFDCSEAEDAINEIKDGTYPDIEPNSLQTI
jgi:hypothetical protein